MTIWDTRYEENQPQFEFVLIDYDLISLYFIGKFNLLKTSCIENKSNNNSDCYNLTFIKH